MTSIMLLLHPCEFRFGGGYEREHSGSYFVTLTGSAPCTAYTSVLETSHAQLQHLDCKIRPRFASFGSDQPATQPNMLLGLHINVSNWPADVADTVFVLHLIFSNNASFLKLMLFAGSGVSCSF